MFKDYLNKTIFIIRVNWAAILAFVAFWCYGFFGAISTKPTRPIGLAANIIVFLILYAIFFIFLFLAQKQNYLEDKFVIKFKDILVFMAYFLILLAFSLPALRSSLVIDEIYHSQVSQRHGINLIFFLSKITSSLDNFSFAQLLWFVNLIIFIIAAIIYIFIRDKSFIAKIVVYSAAFTLFRMFIIFSGGNCDPHPPFRLLPLWISSVLFSETDFSFRLAQFIVLIILMCGIQRTTERKLSLANSWLFGLCAGTIPVLWYTGVIVEQSIWTAFGWTLLLLYLTTVDRNEFNYIAWFSGISILTLIRQPAFIALLPVFLVFFIKILRQKPLKIKDKVPYLLPLLAMLPFLLKGILLGTPSTYMPQETVYVPANLSSIQRIWLSFATGIAPKAIFNAVRLPWLLFLLFAFIPFSRKKKFEWFLVIIFFVCGYYSFYSIRPRWWGTQRYQVEYIVPFVILGFYWLINWVLQLKKFAKGLLCLVFLSLFFYNIFTFMSIPGMNKPVDELKLTYNEAKGGGKVVILSEMPFAYKEAFAEIRRAGFAGFTYIDGITYGVFLEIINGFKIREVLETKKIMDNIEGMRSAKPNRNKAEIINSDPDVRVVLISDSKHQGLIVDLTALGWKRWKDFKNIRYGSTIFGIFRQVEDKHG